MTISDKGVEFICNFEGFSATPYQDSVNVWTIGYGTTFYKNGKLVTKDDQSITKDQAKELLKNYISTKVDNFLNRTFGSLSQEQYDALCSFAYNLGVGALNSSSLKQSIINKENCTVIADNFKKWVKAGGKTLKGLVNRRNAEANLFCNKIYK